jgi:hypothetical protein
MRFQKKTAKDGTLYSLLYKYWVYLILLSLPGIWLIDVFYVADEQKDKSHKLEKVLHKKSDDLTTKRVAESTLDSALTTKTLSLLVSVTLPRTPLTEARTSEVYKDTQHARLKTFMQEPTVAQVKNVMNQLTDLNSRHIQFLLPSGDSAKEAFVNHMYRCENMQFGVLTKASPYQLTLLSVESNRAGLFQPSEFLRVAHDYLNQYERNLLTLYGEGSRPVRIFPMILDINLATKIAKVTGENELKSFSARYFLQGSQIGLTDIVLNQQALTQNWMISPKGCY